MLSKIKVLVQSLLAMSIFYLGFSIYQFTQSLNHLVQTYPQLLEDVNQSVEKLEVKQWLAVAQTVEQVLPSAIAVTAELKQTATEINQTIASVDSKLPQILNQVDTLQSKTVPNILLTIDKVNDQTIPNTLAELKVYREQVLPPLLIEAEGYRTELIPAVIFESEQIRLQAPELIAKADQLVEKSKQISQEATEGAIKGVIFSPVNLIRDAKDGVSNTVDNIKGDSQD